MLWESKTENVGPGQLQHLAEPVDDRWSGQACRSVLQSVKVGGIDTDQLCRLSQGQTKIKATFANVLTEGRVESGRIHSGGQDSLQPLGASVPSSSAW